MKNSKRNKTVKSRTTRERYTDFYNATTYFPTVKEFSDAMGLSRSTCYSYYNMRIPVPEAKIDYIKNRMKTLNLI